jgi:hypothetical protein
MMPVTQMALIGVMQSKCGDDGRQEEQRRLRPKPVSVDVIRVICGYSTANASRTFPPDAALLMA